MNTTMKCVECDKKFDLLDEEQAKEWHYGHDCEEEINEIGVVYDPSKRSY